ncbi:putative C2H2-like zinc finger protein [Hibiscus syriacus]|uniref:Putative C2H2-like zinc finger protein n=1 Tax=Hibiscus syriacus TaxID=106335 RepID=A0A6A3BUF1_HIBSY|nr:zinc finger protein 346-like [Hibiscus syriacus]KAE8720476.1 putative C2H2-like zinc finger protein [Hibiscus syriacus]
MHQSQQQPQQSSFTYLPQSSNPIPNPLLSYPQPPPTHPSHQQFLYPPGTDPYAHQPHFALTQDGFEVNAQFYEDPNGAYQNWISAHADPITCDPNVAALNSNGWLNQSSANNLVTAPNQTGLIQPIRCDVCNIECNTKDVYDKHIAGKKHRRNLQEKISSSIALFPESSNASILGDSGLVNAQELERKKQKLLNSGAAVNSVRMCTICNVACNSYEVFAKHLSGRRHAAQTGLIAVDGIGPYLAAVRANDHFWNKGKKTTKIVQSSWCDVCQINCNSNDAYAKHVSGKKHLKNLENLEKSKNPSMGTPAGTNLMIKPVENPAVAAQPEAASKEDLETKKRKVMEGGAAAAAVRVCTICNVVCNSQKVFEFHLSGQKHAAMVKKQADV